MKNTKKSALTGALLGAAIGACFTLIYTPSPGKEIRRQSAVNFSKVKQSFAKRKRETVELKEKVKDTANVTVSSFKTTAIEVNDAVKQWKDEVRPIIKELHSNINEIQKTISKWEENKQKI